jgi:hypothetical protein
VQNSNCPICHVLLDALLPFTASANENVLATSALMVQESREHLMLVTSDSEATAETRFHDRCVLIIGYSFKERMLYAASLFADSNRYANNIS